MIAFECSSCGKPLKVKDELAGKKVKCPGCQKPAAVPHQAASLSPPPAAPRDERTLPPKVAAGGEERTLPPKEWKKESVSDVGGLTGLGAGQAESTQAIPGERPSAELTDFLSPPQQADEIGRLGPFRVLKVLGSGGMGVVYKAEDPQLKRPVALKAMLPTLGASESARKRFLREAQAAAAIVHDHIVPILQVGEDRGVPFMAMQFLEGEPLDERLRRDKILPVAEVLRIGRETAEGLAAAHEKGLIHRDIKPANIWLEGKKARVKILDFGLARAAADDTHLTQTGAIVGTPAYMAPEQASGKQVDHRCDLFSLGSVLYRLTTGEMPFRGTDTISTLMAVATEQPKTPQEIDPDIPATLSELVMQLLAKKPEDRPQSAQAVVEAIQEIEKQTPDTTARPGHKTQQLKVRGKTKTETTRMQTAPSTKKRLPLPWLVGGGVLVVGVLGLVVFFVASRERQRPEELLSKTFTNSLGMEFVLVPKGKSWLGGGGGQPGDKEVEIKEDFYLGKYEVTQEEWEKITGLNPSTFKAVAGVEKQDQQRFPVEQVAWDDAQTFVERLNRQVKDAGWVYRLPTEVEWEYACRGGSMKDKLESAFDFCFEKATNTLLPDQANFEHGKGLKRTCKVGSYPPNRLGICDMHGNVWEWCADELKDDKGASLRMDRGGGWSLDSGFCRAADRDPHPPSFRNGALGLRLARVPIGKEIVKIIAPEEKKPAVEVKLSPTFTNSLGMKFMLIPAGKFTMGSSQQEIERCIGLDKKYATYLNSEAPEHEVEITQPFYMGATEVTLGQFRQFVTEKKYQVGDDQWQKPGFEQSDDHPVVWVSWQNAVDFCAWLSAKEGKKYRLPTEAEWEFSCRAGKAGTRYGFGNQDADLGLYAWHSSNSGGKTHSVGKLKANEWGLHDMHGNAWEWCQDNYHPNYYKNSPKQNPLGPSAAGERVLRGGSWGNVPMLCRSAFRNLHALNNRDWSLGFRVVLLSSPGGKEPVAGPDPAENKTPVVSQPAAKLDYGLLFDGKGSYVEIPTLRYDGTHPVTVEAWVIAEPLRLSHVFTCPGPHGFSLYAADHWGCAGYSSTSKEYLMQSAPERAAAKVKYHLAGVWDGREPRIFVDGNPGRGEQKRVPLEPSTGGAIIGGVTQDARRFDRFFAGIIAELRVSKVARYTGKFQPQTRFTADADTLALYHCDEGQGATLLDSSANKHHGKIHGATWLPARQSKTPPATFTNSLGMEFVLVPKGKSWLGGGGGKPGDKEVEIKEDFYLGKYEVTQEEWEKVTGSNPSQFKGVAGVSKEDQKRFPVEQVSWEDCQVFIERLNKQVKDVGWAYRLPKEVEWEYACRGGPLQDKVESAFDFYFEKPTNMLLPEQANFEHGKGLKRTCKVGSYKPNRLGLYDMHGNVWEWCADELNDDKGASRRVDRGGGWDLGAGYCRVTFRGQVPPLGRHSTLGLRLARVPVGKEIVKIIAPEEKKPPVEAKQPVFKNSLGMEFALVPKGRFLMGVGGDMGTKEVSIDHDFYLGLYEVTQWEWAATTGQNPSTFSRNVKGVEDADLKRFPVESVSWDDAQLFLREVNKRAKEPGWVYRLPREAEWEYACRGGPLSNKLDYGFDYYLGKPNTTLLPSQANYRLEQGKSLGRTCKVGSYQPNRLGLYDMHGNVWEWCDDVEKAADGASLRVLRGGSWLYSSWECRAASRLANPPSHRHNCIGLRLARVPVGKE